MVEIVIREDIAANSAKSYGNAQARAAWQRSIVRRKPTCSVGVEKRLRSGDAETEPSHNTSPIDGETTYLFCRRVLDIVPGARSRRSRVSEARIIRLYVLACAQAPQLRCVS